MKHIKTQAQFDALVVSTPTNEKVLIYPREDGSPYSLSSVWKLPSNAFIEGINSPVINYVSTNNIKCEGVYGGELTNITIRNLIIVGTGSEFGVDLSYVGVTPQPGYMVEGYDINTVGVNRVNTKGIHIEGCIIRGFWGGIRVSHSGNCNITGNVIENCAGASIYPNYASTAVISKNTILNNVDGIVMIEAENCMVYGNEVIYNKDTAIGLWGQCNIVSGNVAIGSSYGIEMDRAKNNTVVNNTIINCPYYSVKISGSDNNTMVGNIIQGGQRGVTVGNFSSGNVLYSNITSNNTIASTTVDTVNSHNNKMDAVYNHFLS